MNIRQTRALQGTSFRPMPKDGEVRQQNRELLAALDELRRANEVKTRFLSNMAHEFRTPLASILSLARLLTDRVDGELTPEQERQVNYIRRSADSLLELVNDLLDLAEVEAGKVRIRAARFSAGDLLGAVRGMLRPLLAPSSALTLVFEDAASVPDLETDEGKVSQILRNFVSNALKFTERGEVRVSATHDGDGFVRFTVADTGIGIAAEDHERVFEEFGQVEHPIQKLVRGTGLGLPLSRKLADLLGGRIVLESEVGRGSSFSLVVPIKYSGPVENTTSQPF
ncbi:MAG: sensor histidine kinase [Planctomycetota bacterium]